MMIIRRYSSALVLASVLAMPVLVACEGTLGDVISAKDAGSSDSATLDPDAAVVGKVKTNKVDLLFMIDNSASMADKQMVLALAIPDLVQRITNPKCIDPSSKIALPREKQPTSFAQACPDGSVREFLPIDDIHIGVISSSLGGHGGQACQPADSYNPTQNDAAHLLTRNASGGTVETWDGKGFLDWDPTQTKSSPAGDKDPTILANKFRDLVLGAGQVGCGIEAQLESVYRFLVDPAPYNTIEKVPCSTGDTGNNCIAGHGVDQVVLAERQGFLRPDSLVSIVMLTDENDCSIVDSGQSQLLTTFHTASGTPIHLPRATSACESNPLSPECKSCGAVDISLYPECQNGLTDLEDPANLRCFHQKQRFGFDWLQPVQRYISGFSKPVLDDGRVNPLFCASPSVDGSTCNTDLRDPSLVVVAGIVGVPWQDLARNPKDLREGIKSSGEIQWDDIIGKPESFVEPNDPFMRESTTPRTGTNPFTGENMAAPTDAWNANSINGHERNAVNDLQYACTFELPTSLECDYTAGAWCDCENQSNPLCQSASDPAGSAKKQYRGKAYPGIRQLSVLKALGTQGIVASICTPNITDPTRDDFGYRPAVQALGDRLALSLVSK